MSRPVFEEVTEAAPPSRPRSTVLTGHGPSRSSSPFESFDDQLDEARKALTVSIASLRAAELQLDDIQHARSPNADHAASLCKQSLALRDALHQRLTNMFDEHDHIDDAKLPQRLNAGSPAPPCKDAATASACSFNLPRRRSSSAADEAFDLPHRLSRQPARACLDSPCLDSPQTAGASQGRSVLETVSAVLIDLDGTMYNPLGAIPGADEFYAFLHRRKIPCGQPLQHRQRAHADAHTDAHAGAHADAHAHAHAHAYAHAMPLPGTSSSPTLAPRTTRARRPSLPGWASCCSNGPCRSTTSTRPPRRRSPTW